MSGTILHLDGETWDEPGGGGGMTARALPGQEASGSELAGFVKQRIGSVKAPKQVVFTDLPKTSTGKIQKFVLRERAKSASAIE